MINPECYLIVLAVFLIMGLMFFIFYKKLSNKYKEDIERRVKDSEDSAYVKELFLANISHETRTPLNIIIGLTHLLQQTRLDDAQKKQLETIERSSNLLLSITNEILDFSKIDAGKMEINHIEFDLNDILDDLANMISVGARKKGLELLFNVDPDIDSTVIGDSLRLTQVLVNLLNNAVKFTEKGSVVLKVKKISDGDTQTLRFEVIDTGIGMTKDQTLNIFEAFTQADSSRKLEGTGLGLAISKELVKMMDGELDVKSELRHGSTFGVTLSFALSQKQDIKQHKYIARLLMDKYIMIMDESESAVIMADLLAYFGARPIIPSRRNEIDKLLQFNNFDVVIVNDLYLKDRELMKNIHRHSKNVVSVIYDSIDYRHDDVTALYKPFTPLRVLNVMAGLFDKSIAKQSLKKKAYTFEDILPLGGSRVLLAEDNEGNRMVVQGLLQDSDIIVIEAEDGQKAVQTMLNTSEKFDLILMDINMPIMDGYVSTSIIREYEQFDSIPIIALTANITQTQIDKAKSYGMQAYLNKPIDTEYFYKTLLQYITPKRKVSSNNIQNTQTTSTEYITELPGIDMKDGLSRVNGNQKIYNNILFKFADLFANSIVTLQEMLSIKNYKAAADYAHNLKGLAGNIGATTIYEIAEDLDHACREQPSNALTIVRELDLQLRPLLESIAKHTDKNPRKSNKAIIPESILNNYLNLLNEAASRQKGRDAKKMCEALNKYSWPENKQEILSKIIRASESYDFERVQKLIAYMNNNR